MVSVVIAMPMMTSIFLSGKYFERRKRNNLAAKKSRDQRKVNIFKTMSFLYYLILIPRCVRVRFVREPPCWRRRMLCSGPRLDFYFILKNVIKFLQKVGTLRDEAGSLRSLLLQRKIAKRKEFKVVKKYV